MPHLSGREFSGHARNPIWALGGKLAMARPSGFGRMSR